MRKPRLCCRRALAVVELLSLGLGVCANGACAIGFTADVGRGPSADPIPAGGSSPAATGGAASAPPPIGGTAGYRPVAGAGIASAGTWAEAGRTGGTVAPPGEAGTTVMPVAGSGGGTLPPFDAGTDANRNMVGPGALCARLAAIQCAAEVHCCTNPKHTRETCQTQSTMLCSANLYLDQIAMNAASGFDPAATASAFSKFEEKARQCDITVAAWAGSADGLLGMFKGTLPPGANCTPANRADLPMAAAALASCTGNSTSACLANGVLGDWTCAPKNAAGGSCHTDLNCATGNYCANVGKTGFGKCAPLLALEAPCTEGNQCSSLSCSDGKCVPPGQQVAYCVVLP